MRVAITGGATGIGAATIEKLKARGATVTAFDIAEPKGADFWVKVDLSDPASINAALAAAKGPFDALLNNAGVPPKEGLAAMVLKINYIGFRMFHDGMLDQLRDGAAIVNTASRAGMMWRENLDEVNALRALPTFDDVDEFVTSRGIDATRAYNLSKEAVIVETMARTEDLIRRGLRANSVSPAAVSTGILDDFLQAFGDRARNAVARAGRAGAPEEIADLIVFLASPESNWIKGQNVLIDGGMSAMAMSDGLGLTA